jgi:hypothetical protein
LEQCGVEMARPSSNRPHFALTTGVEIRFLARGPVNSVRAFFVVDPPVHAGAAQLLIEPFLCGFVNESNYTLRPDVIRLVLSKKLFSDKSGSYPF